MARSKPKAKDQSENTVVGNALAADDNEDRPFMVRVLTVGVSSYLAQRVWTKRKMLTDGWYKEEMTETQHSMVTAFEYMSAMGLIFVIGIVVGVVINKMAKWVRIGDRGHRIEAESRVQYSIRSNNEENKSDQIKLVI